MFDREELRDKLFFATSDIGRVSKRLDNFRVQIGRGDLLDERDFIDVLKELKRTYQELMLLKKDLVEPCYGRFRGFSK